MDRFQEHWRFSSASSTGAAEMYRCSSSTYRNRAHWLAGAGQRRRSPPWPLFPVSPARTPEYLEPSSVRHRERAPTLPAPFPLTSTRGPSSDQGPFTPAARGGDADGRASGPLVVGASAAATPRRRRPSNYRCCGRSLPWVPRWPRAAGVLGINGPRR